jgi:hypothetical protein
MAAEIKGDRKGARDVEKAIGQARGALADQEIGAGKATRGALAVLAHELPVKDLHRVGHVLAA